MKKYCVLLIICSALATGCGMRYKVANETFSSSTKALRRQSEIYANALDTVTAVDAPIHGNVLVILPSPEEIRRSYLILGGNARLLGETPFGFAIASYENENNLIPSALTRSKIFDSIAIERHNGNPASYPIGDNDYLIFRDVDGWFIRSKSSPRALAIMPDQMPPSQVVGPKIPPFLKSFINSVIQQATALKDLNVLTKENTNCESAQE